MTNPIHIGTSGWSYEDWVGPFYPAGTAQRDFLCIYAKYFPVVEVDSTYYRPPSRRLVAEWAGKTPENFRFALKAPSEVTHKKVLVDCDRDMDELLEAVEPLGARLRGVLLQFGYFNRAAFRSAEEFFERLDAFLERYAPRAPLAVEIRNRNWLSRAYFELLRRRNVAATLVEHAWLPPIERLIEQQDVVTGPFSYVRLIGDREGIEKITTKWGAVVVDRERDLRRVAAALRKIAQRAELMVFINNHYAGHGPASCRRLREILDA